MPQTFSVWANVKTTEEFLSVGLSVTYAAPKTGLRSSARPPVHPLPPRGQPVAVASKFEKGNNNRNKFGRNDGVAGPSTATEICPPAHTRSQEDWTATTKTTTGDDEVL